MIRPLAVRRVRHPLALVDIAIGVGEAAPALRFVRLPVPLVPGAIGPDLRVAEWAKKHGKWTASQGSGWLIRENP